MENDKIWQELREKLPYDNSENDVALRQKYWSAIDVNNNGYLSLAELDKGMRDVVQIPILFDTKPVIMRAYQSAKNKLKAKSKVGDDYVSRAEFKFFLQYLRQYYEYWVAFDRIDTNDDRRVSKDEFEKAVPIMNKWGLNIKDAGASFKEADKDGKGMILFIEFCDWAIRKNLDLEDDDDAL